MKQACFATRRVLSAVLAMAMLLSLCAVGGLAAQATSAVVDFSTAEAAQSFQLYSTSAGGFQVQDGKLAPTGDAGEFKAIYQADDAPISAVSVELHPVGNDGPIYGGLYIGASNAGDAQDAIDALYIGIESNFVNNAEGTWEDAPNRIDLVLGSFNQSWGGELGRTISETGAGNALFSGGVKQPLRLYAQMQGNVLTVSMSLVSDPANQITTTYVAPEGTDLTLGDVGIRSHYNNAMFDNFAVEYVAQESVEAMPSGAVGFTDTQDFQLYSTSAGGFVAQNGKLTPSGDVGEYKAIYNGTGAVESVSVELHPVGNDGPIYGGLYIGASNAGDAQDAIDALYIGIESNFVNNAEGTWEDAPNRIDLVLGSFNQGWGGELGRTISETGAGNNLFSGGVKEPIVLRADITGAMVVITVSLLRDPSVSFGTTYVADRDLSQGQVGVRSHYNNAMFDNFCVNTQPGAAAAAVADFADTQDFQLYSTSAGGFVASEGKLMPSGDVGEYKAIYNGTGNINSVSVELHPVGNDGPIYGGLYIGASNAGNAQDAIDALYIGIESNFVNNAEGTWEDAPNRIDLVIGSFPAWEAHSRVVSETGAGNNLFSGGVKEPIVLRADICGNTVTATVSLLSDPSRSVSATYKADWNLSQGQVGIRSHHNNAMYDNFAVNAAAVAGEHVYSTVSQAVRMAGENVVKLLANTDETVTVLGDTTIDLAGHSMTQLLAAEGSSLKLVDSSSDDYAGAHGSAYVVGNVQTFCQAEGKNYLTVGQEGVYTAHRYGVQITHISLDPSKEALGYKASISGDETVFAHVTAVGYNMWLDGGQMKNFSTAAKEQVTLRLTKILYHNGGEMNVNANAFVTLQVGELENTLTSADQVTTMKQTLEQVNALWYNAGYTQQQQEAVISMCQPYRDILSGWGLDNILFEGVNFDQAVSLGEQSYTFATTATYTNGQDIAGQWGPNEYTNGGDYGIGDPFVLRHNGMYYMYPSSGVDENAVKVYSSSDLVNWTYEGNALEVEEAYHAYAPEVIYHNGWFYMCQSGNGGKGHYIYKSQSPLGPFTAVTGNVGCSIDGAFWLDDDGEIMFLYPSNNTIYIASLDQDMVPGGGTKLNASLNDDYVEGPGLFRRGDVLYLTYSGNEVTSDDYRVGYSYQLGSDPAGSFIQPEDNVLILAEGPDNFRGLGHNANVLGPNLDSWYATYHNLVSVDGPQRRYMLDQLVTNGGQVMANGPTYWQVSVPQGPDFSRQSLATVDGLWLSGAAAEAVFTAEFNFTPVSGGQTRFVFAYVDQNNYSEALWNDADKTLTVIKVTDGESQTLGAVTMDALASHVLHTLRIEQGGNRLMVYMDTMRKIDVTNTALAGQIGVSGDASFGYIAFSNHAFGTSDFDTVKNAGSAFPAVHYLRGETLGFSIANAQLTNGIRQGEKENTLYDAATGSYELVLDTQGDWVKYAIHVHEEGQYDLTACLDAVSAGATFQVIVDNQDIYEITVPTMDSEGAVEQLLTQLSLTAGTHTLKIRLRQGQLRLQSFGLTAAAE